VELALVSFLLILLVIAVIDFARAFNSYVVITNASREGARYGARFSHDKDGILTAAKQETEGSSVMLDEVADVDVDPDPDPDNDGDTSDGTIAQPGDPITVTVSYDFPTILGDFVGAGSLTLRARTRMVVFWMEDLS
jgi:Flp pilus assembly protein TadG